MPSSKVKNLTALYSFIQGLYWMNFAAIMSYSSYYLLSRGFSNTEIGVIIAVAGILSAVLQPVLASYADDPKSPSLKKFLLILLIFQLVFGILLLFLQIPAVIGILYGLSIALLQILTPFISALGMESINQGQKLNFGFARGMGSVAYACLSYILGIATGKAGASAVPVFIMLITLSLTGVVAVFPFAKTNIEPASRKASSQSSNPLVFFRKYKRFTLVLLGCIFIYISHVLLNNFTYQIIETKGGGSAQMGTATAIAAMSELPTLFLFGFIIRKIRCDILLRISGIFFTLKALGSLLAPNVSVFYGIQITQMLGWGLMTATSVYYVSSIMEKEDAIKGQAYFTMTYTLGSVAAAFIGGALIDLSGVNAMLLFSVLTVIIGAIIVFFSAEKKPVRK